LSGEKGEVKGPGMGQLKACLTAPALLLHTTKNNKLAVIQINSLDKNVGPSLARVIAINLRNKSGQCLLSFII
jgi:hypothetical protein